MKTRTQKVEEEGWQPPNSARQAFRRSNKRFGSNHILLKQFFDGGFVIGRTCRMIVLLLGVLFSITIAGVAQSYSIDWHKISGGGGTSSNGQYTVSGTIGQHDAGGPMVGGNYSLTGGFWAIFSVVQTVGAPKLYISHAGNTVTVYWQDVSGWNLQQNNNLANDNNWSASIGVVKNSGTNYLSLHSPSDNLFFRLKFQ